MLYCRSSCIYFFILQCISIHSTLLIYLCPAQPLSCQHFWLDPVGHGEALWWIFFFPPLKENSLSYTIYCGAVIKYREKLLLKYTFSTQRCCYHVYFFPFKNIFSYIFRSQNCIDIIIIGSVMPIFTCWFTFAKPKTSICEPSTVSKK